MTNHSAPSGHVTTCSPLIGCSCPAGWELGEDGHECVDSDECVGNNGHGPCQDTCLNTQVRGSLRLRLLDGGGGQVDI